MMVWFSIFLIVGCGTWIVLELLELREKRSKGYESNAPKCPRCGRKWMKRTTQGNWGCADCLRIIEKRGGRNGVL